MIILEGEVSVNQANGEVRQGDKRHGSGIKREVLADFSLFQPSMVGPSDVIFSKCSKTFLDLHAKFQTPNYFPN